MSVPFRLRLAGVNVGRGVEFHGMPVVSLAAASSIEIGAGAVLSSHSAFTALGISRPCILRTMRNNASIEVGENTGISGGVICAAVSVKIGRECLFGADVIVMDTDFHALDPTGRRFNSDPETIAAAEITIGDNVFIGARSMILKGVKVGSHSVIGAGSIVSSDLGSRVLAAGSPARRIRDI